jgi:uroporphyrinogen-III synthase
MTIEGGFGGLRVAAFESRMEAEMKQLITRYGGEPLVAPALREVPLEDNRAVLEFGDRLLAGTLDMVILLTGVGTQAMLEALESRAPAETINRLLARVTLVARGPKPTAVLKKRKLTPQIAVPEPNTWHDVLQALDAHGSLKGLRVALQEYGAPSNALLAGLRERGAEVTSVPVYRWALPEDIQALRRVLDAILGGQVAVALITNAAQVDHIMQVLSEAQQADAFRKALAGMVVASVGPTASERLRGHGLAVDLEPSHPKMGLLVKEASEQAGRILLEKGGGRKDEGGRRKAEG